MRLCMLVSVFIFRVCACVCVCVRVCARARPLQPSEAYCVAMHTCISHEGSTHWSVDEPRTTIIHTEGPSQFSCCHAVLSACMAEQPARPLQNVSSGLQRCNAPDWRDAFFWGNLVFDRGVEGLWHRSSPCGAPFPSCRQKKVLTKYNMPLKPASF